MSDLSTLGPHQFASIKFHTAQFGIRNVSTGWSWAGLQTKVTLLELHPGLYNGCHFFHLGEQLMSIVCMWIPSIIYMDNWTLDCPAAINCAPLILPPDTEPHIITVCRILTNTHTHTCFQPAPPPTPSFVLYFHLPHLLCRYATLLHIFQSVAFSISYVQRVI